MGVSSPSRVPSNARFRGDPRRGPARQRSDCSMDFLSRPQKHSQDTPNVRETTPQRAPVIGQPLAVSRRLLADRLRLASLSAAAPLRPVPAYTPSGNPTSAARYCPLRVDDAYHGRPLRGHPSRRRGAGRLCCDGSRGSAAWVGDILEAGSRRGTLAAPTAAVVGVALDGVGILVLPAVAALLAASAAAAPAKAPAGFGTLEVPAVATLLGRWRCRQLPRCCSPRCRPPLLRRQLRPRLLEVGKMVPRCCSPRCRQPLLRPQSGRRRMGWGRLWWWQSLR
ncbi:hypothetical protein I4F81_010045 [Pyropia yezoensis]|uniref:Uncharacterized protein n=1 Tax=Pyropia yezoensis TaxID=2788 RepID=A0ACC3CCH1_PYRYE|nr:hypothetical protein I4F81_010045 [Neopyropia yezoensis]